MQFGKDNIVNGGYYENKKGRLLNRMLAVLLAAVLTAGMVSNAVQASVLAQEESGTGSVSANDAEPTEEENGNLQALLERIAALPDVGGAALDAENGGEDAYEEWLAGLYAHGEEALALQEALEALSEEEQAKIPEDALAKLAAWAEIAGQAAQGSTVMAADDNITDNSTTAHIHPVCGASCSHTGAESHGNVAWTALSQDSFTGGTDGGPKEGSGVKLSMGGNYILAAGSYYLAENITVDKEIRITDGGGSGTVNLCLGGHTPTSSCTGNARAVVVPSGSTLSLCDCQGGGKIIGNARFLLEIKESEDGQITSANLYGGTLEHSGDDSCVCPRQSDAGRHRAKIRQLRH